MGEVQHAMWLPPEFITRGLISPKLDVWSFACLILEMSTGLPPYYGTNIRWESCNPVTIHEYLKGNPQAPKIVVNSEIDKIKNGVDDVLGSLLESMLVMDVEERPDFINKKEDFTHWRCHDWIQGKIESNEKQKMEE